MVLATRPLIRLRDWMSLRSRPPKYDSQLTPAAPLTSSTAALGATPLATSVANAVALEIALFYFERRGCKCRETVPIIGLAEPSERRLRRGRVSSAPTGMSFLAPTTDTLSG